MLPNYTIHDCTKRIGKIAKKKLSFNTRPCCNIPPQKTYITIATKGTLSLTGQNEESKQNLEEQSVEVQFSDPLCQLMVSNRLLD